MAGTSQVATATAPSGWGWLAVAAALPWLVSDCRVFQFTQAMIGHRRWIS